MKTGVPADVPYTGSKVEMCCAVVVGVDRGGRLSNPTASLLQVNIFIFLYFTFSSSLRFE